MLCGHNALHVRVVKEGGRGLGDLTEEENEGGSFWCTLSIVSCGLCSWRRNQPPELLEWEPSFIQSMHRHTYMCGAHEPNCMMAIRQRKEMKVFSWRRNQPPQLLEWELSFIQHASLEYESICSVNVLIKPTHPSSGQGL